MHSQLAISHHAKHRQARRNVSVDDIHFVLAYGQRFYCAGAMHVFLGRRNLPEERDLYRRYAHLEGTVLVLHERGHRLVLLTVYRNRQGLKAIKSKAVYDRRPRLVARSVGATLLGAEWIDSDVVSEAFTTRGETVDDALESLSVGS